MGRILTIAVLSVAAYYLSFYLATLWQLIADAITRGPEDFYDVWWVRRRQAIATGVIGACTVAGIVFWRGFKTTTWRERTIACAVLAVIIGVQPFIQLEMLKRSLWGRLERGETGPAAFLAMLGVHEAIPTLVEESRAGGTFALMSAKDAIRFGQRSAIEQIALDLAASPSARTATALAAMDAYGRQSDPRFVAVLLDVLQDPDPLIRLLMLERLREAELGLILSSELITEMRERLLLDVDPQVRLSALKVSLVRNSPYGCEVAPRLFRDPERDVQLAAFELYQRCYRFPYRDDYRRRSDRHMLEEVAVYLTILDHPEPDIRARAAESLFALGNNAGVDVAMQFVRGDPSGKNEETMAGAIEVIARTLNELVAPALWTISQCESRHHLRSRTWAWSELLRIYSRMGVEVPIQYRRDSPNPAPMLSDYCPS